MTTNDIQKTEKAMLVIREQLDNVVIPDPDTLEQLNDEMQKVFVSTLYLRTYIETLEKAYGSLEQYGIADELKRYNKEN